jgi:alkanesulfonate monooxygenase
MSRIKFGIALQNYVAADEYIHPRELIDVASLAEELNFNSVWVWDHLILGSKRFFPIHESLTILSAVASHTQRVKLGTGVYLLSLRNPLVVAKQITTIDNLSDGRVVFGVASGWYEREFKACGIDFRRRGEILEQKIMILKKLWMEDVVNEKVGEYEFVNVRIEPKPLQRPHPPILMGGYVDKVLQRIAKLSDGWVSYFYKPTSFENSWRKICNYCKIYGKDVSTFTNCDMVPALVSRNREEGLELVKSYVHRYCDLPPWSEASVESSITGRPRECVEYVEQYIEAGVKELVLIPAFSNLSEVKDRVRELGDKIVSSF